MKNLFSRLFNKAVPAPAQDWRLVFTVETSWEHISLATGAQVDKGKVYYHLFESDRGNRKATINASPRTVELMRNVTAENYHEVLREVNKVEVILSTGAFALTNNDWNNKIYPWLVGRYDPEIPTYESIPRKEFRDNLAGKKA